MSQSPLMTSMKNKVIALIAVRLKSTRLPMKAVADLDGLPLIQRLHERLLKSSLLNEIIWCTSTNPQDDPLEDIAKAAKAKIFRGSELDVISRFIAVANNFNADTVVRITGDNPLTDPKMLDYMIKYHLKNDAEYSYTDDLPRGTRSEIIKISTLKHCYELIEDSNSSEYMTLMLKRPDKFKVLNIKTPNEKIRRPELRLTVDTQEDLDVIQKIYNVFNGNPPELAKIIQWLDLNPLVKNTNAHIIPTQIDSSINFRHKGDLV